MCIYTISAELFTCKWSPHSTLPHPPHTHTHTHKTHIHLPNTQISYIPTQRQSFLSSQQSWEQSGACSGLVSGWVPATNLPLFSVRDDFASERSLAEEKETGGLNVLFIGIMPIASIARHTKISIPQLWLWFVPTQLFSSVVITWNTN